MTLISGLGGKERLREHALGCASLVNAVQPEYLGFLTLMLEEPAPILSSIRSGALTLLSPEDVVEEMQIFLEHVDAPGTVFRSNHASNYVMLKGTLNRDIPGMLRQLQEIKEQCAYRPEQFRAL